MDFTDPIPFREAIRILAAKKLMPTTLTSAELGQADRQIVRSAFTSAQTNIEGLLDRYKTGVMNIIAPSGAPAEDFNPASLRAFIKGYLQSISYVAPAGKEGTIEDLSSDGRVNLVVKTNVELAQGAGSFIQGNANEDVVDLYPAWELVRYEQRMQPRDWKTRWKIAAETAGDPNALAAMVNHGRMAALKSSGIWQALGDGAGGYDDTLGNPYPPFAFNSGMWTDDVSRKDAVAMGLIGEDEDAAPARFDFSSLFKAAA